MTYLRELRARLDTTEGSTLEAAASDEEEGARGDLGTSGSDTNESGNTPTTSGHEESLLHGVDVTDSLCEYKKGE